MPTTTNTNTNTNTNSKSTTLRFEDGAVQFRQRLAVSILSHRPLLIRNIRADDIQNPGLQEHEASFLRLMDRMTNGSTIEINATGTQLRFKPGVLLGGEVEHVCPVPAAPPPNNNNEDDGGGGGGGGGGSNQTVKTMRSVGWYLEGILPLAPFGKEPLDLTLTGITDGLCQIDPSPDYLSTTVLPLFAHLGIGTTTTDNSDPLTDSPPSITTLRRGAAPHGSNGTVRFTCPITRELTHPLDLTDPGLIKRVRGTVVSCRLPPSSAARVAHSAKGMLLRLLPDVWIHTDAHSSSNGCGPSPGLSVCLTAESTTGVVLSAETCLGTLADGGVYERGRVLPEDLGSRSAAMVLEEVRRGGCVDTGVQSLVFLMMCLGPEDVARVRVGTLSRYAMESLRLFKEVFGVEFKVRADEESRTVVLSCLGTGYRNMARAST